MLHHFCFRAGLLMGMMLAWLAPQAQTVHPDYLDGRIYLQFGPQQQTVIPDVASILQGQRFPAWQDLIQTYDIEAIERPFLALATPQFERSYRLTFGRIEAVDALLAELAALPHVAYAERAPLYRTQAIPNDSLWAQVATHLELIQADDAWDLHTGGGATVAIIDDAVQITHPDLTPNLWTNPGEIPGDSIDNDGNGYIDDVHGYDVSDDDDGDPNPPASANAFSFSHGTHCAGIAAARTDNLTGVASVSHSCQLIGIKATRDGSIPLFIENTLEGFAYAITVGADVVSASFGGGGFSQMVQDLLDEGHRRGIIMVAAAGNDNSDQIQYPAGYDHVIAVASTTVQDLRSGFSNYGSWVDIAAPGSNIFSTVAFDGYTFYSGTSMACPMAAGLLALMKSYRPGFPPEVYEYAMRRSADNIDTQNPNFVGDLGTGRINAFQALRELLSCYPLASDTTGPRLDTVQIGAFVDAPFDLCPSYRFDWEEVLFRDLDLPLPLRIRLGSCGTVHPRQMAVFVDWNADGDFSDAQERVWESGFVAGDVALSQNIPVPATVSRDREVRLRIIVRSDSGQIIPCADFQQGQTADYLLRFLPPLCPANRDPVASFPYEVDFEDFALCDTTPGVPCALSQDWVNDSLDALDWIAHQGETPTPGTGPNTDFEPSTAQGTYLYLEASGGQPEQQARLLSPCLDLSQLADPQLVFGYHMFGADMGSLTLEIRGEGPWRQLWRESGNRLNIWRVAILDLSEYAGQLVRLRFVAERGAGEAGDMALGFLNLGDAKGCGGLRTLRSTADLIEDGSGRYRNYGNDMDCRWLIQPYNAARLRIAFDRFRTIPQQDVLRAHDGENQVAPQLIEWSGFSTDSLLVEGGSAYLRFLTDPDIGQDGWLLRYEAELLPDVLRYQLPARSALSGQVLRVPLQVQDFTDIYRASAQLYVADTSVAQFVPNGSFLAPGVGGSLITSSSPDSLRITWQGSPSSPVSLTPGDTLAFLTLRLTGDPGDSTALWLPTATPATYQARRRIGASNVSVLLPGGDSTVLRVRDPNVSIAGAAPTSWQIGPNPFTTQLRLHLLAPQGGQLRISDAMGRTMWQQQVLPRDRTQALTLNSSAWANGWYLCTFSTAQGILTRTLWRLSR